MRLQVTSPVIDAGSNGLVPIDITTDLDGKLRFNDVPSVVDTGSGIPPIVDMGAYERQEPGYCGPDGMLFVNHAASGAKTGLSWTNAFTDLQTALERARNCEVWVAAGVYYPTETTDRTQTFLLRSGVQVYGGFVGSETLLEERDWFANPTVLSGDIDQNDTNKDANGIVTTVADIQGNNAYHVLVGSGVDATAVFDGFILNAGKADGTILYHNQGGGVYLTLGNPSLNNLVISANQASGAGGGLFNDRSNASLSNIALRGNNIPGSGHQGGGMFNHAASPTLSNVLFSGNHAYDGGGLFTDGGDPILINPTFSGNNGDHYGSNAGAIYVAGGNPTLTNAILWGNNSTILLSGGTATVTHSLVQGGYTGEGNLDVDPLFVEMRSYGEAPTTAGDYRLRYNSPAIEVGNNSPLTVLTDLDNNPRLVDSDSNATSVVDLGVYEWQAYTLTVNIAGGGTINKDPDRGTFGYLEQVSLSANADTGWTFAYWSGDASGTDNPLIFTMDGNTSITANFAQIEYTMTATVYPESAGSVMVDPAQPAYHYGDTITLTAVPELGWTFKDWSGGASGTDNPLTFTIFGNTSITANFTQIEYTLTVIVDPLNAGSVTVNPAQPAYHYGDTTTLTAYADTGWTFAGWEGDEISTDNPLTVMIQANTSITARFALVLYKLFLPMVIR